MNEELIGQIAQYVEENIVDFHQARINKLKTLKLDTVLRKKNPYLFKAKYLLSAPEIVQSLSDAFISSAEETIFGDWLERLAIFVCSNVYNARKSATLGIDMEFDKDGIRYIVSIKSGPNWGNSSQIRKMKEDFNSAKRVLRTSGTNIQVVAINGCCYGKDKNPDKGDYFKYCGQKFWEFISGEPTLYSDILEPIATDAKKKNEDFKFEYTKMINKLTLEFLNNYCNNDGSINWDKIMLINSSQN